MSLLVSGLREDTCMAVMSHIRLIIYSKLVLSIGILIPLSSYLSLRTRQ